MLRSILLFIFLCLFSITTFSSAVEAGKASETVAAAQTSKGVKPGSDEDWCDEHEVRESLCTSCNPALIPAFKATKDWCQEHGLPESQCRKCNPNLKINRPPKRSEG